MRVIFALTGNPPIEGIVMKQKTFSFLWRQIMGSAFIKIKINLEAGKNLNGF